MQRRHFSFQTIKTSLFGSERRLRGVVIAALVCLPLFLIVTMGVMLVQWRQGRAVHEAVNSAYETRLQLKDAFALLQDAETGQRGYILTGDASYLVPYHHAVARIPAALDGIEPGLDGDASQAAGLRRIRDLVEMKRRELAQTVALRREGREAEALAQVRRGTGQQVMDQIRSEMTRISDFETARSAVRLANEQKVIRDAGLLLGTLGVGLLLLLAGAVFLVTRGLKALKAERDAADRANRAKSTFLAMMSHELRTPMNGVLGMAHVLGKSRLTRTQAGWVEVIEKSGRGLMLVLNDILDLSKIEAGQIELEARPFDLNEVVLDAADLWRTGAAEKGIEVRVEIQDGLKAGVEGDGARVRQILLNLLSNAVKFTERGQVVVRLEADEPVEGVTAYRIAVADNGPGVAPEMVSKLFQPFVQEDASISRRFGGTGLGLSISRQLARLMGGDIEVESVQGEGATFTVTLPLAAAQVAEQGAEQVGDEEIDEGLRILVAEDNPHNQTVVRAFLQALGLRGVIVDNGQEALDALTLARFDVVLMDIHMPVMDGATALEAIRAGRAGEAGIPVVALTADAMSGDRERYLAAGFDEHLAKPIDPARFVAVLSALSQRTPEQRSAAA